MRFKENFTQKIKQELLAKKKTRQEISDFLRGFIFAGGNIGEYILLKITASEVQNYILDLLASVKINFDFDGNLIKIRNRLVDLKEIIFSPWAFFAGVFVASGSISNLDKSSYHLQISSRYEKYIDLFQSKLNEYDFGFQKIKHQNRYLIYIKKHEKISDFLKAITAIDSMFLFEDSRIQRDFDNSMNRINNVDVANIKKVVESNQKHIKNIEIMIANNLQHHFNPNQIAFYNLMHSNPEESLNSYANILSQSGIEISKSGLNHWLIKLAKIVKKNAI
ncbi:hypothetical protein MCAL160_0570 [Mycoplasmopsis californica HAZ160_1]|uniref:Probable cell division protein WhiA n=1 Tax=Mycoplasmopsis californica HAZ160_1 TaxID=1397850 RepID=A0AAT9F860_9BACT|nr:DNA-binding protein WhiA [Mycoplasmopsis californica]BAP01092.1 hypothetical protein MCAL160_0570 [Mycoplasmopsis californica HAZ160_1]BBG40957.1 hypothetical protein MCAL106_0570 [Mycoplasmopsis californica]BBG41551.1 hypothetical protein MCAL106E_0570 [Mycoplasmopsis californica]BBG42144.1 hypothetical protein MCAL106L_0570 [Mycoplasmopsis californica]BBG42727.1 hypothetical protein MCAL160E_0570 [Mycoplasmopsis californica]